MTRSPLRAVVYRAMRLVMLVACASIGAMSLSGCLTTAMLVYNHIQNSPKTKGCDEMTTAERAMTARCGEYVEGSITVADANRGAPDECPLTLAAADPSHWALLPELIAKGAQPERCTLAPMLAASRMPADRLDAALHNAPQRQVDALRWLASADARAFRPEVVHMLTTPAARAAGLQKVVEEWASSGQLDPRNSGFEPLAWLHPSATATPVAAILLARGHRPTDAVRSHPECIEEAMAAGDVKALDWWLGRVPGLADLVPDSRDMHLPWRPLAYVAGPGTVPAAELRPALVRKLLDFGADPNAPMPYDQRMTVVQYAAQHSPQLVALMQPPPAVRAPTVAAVAPTAAATVGVATATH